jgi:DNA repair protein RecN (Recombination protein N)
MLCEVHIINLALIEKLSLYFGKGLSVLTGETGAGKSIILQAIHLLSGGKASASWVRAGTQSATIEALFDLGRNHHFVLEKLKEKGFETDGTIILKRILSIKGRSRFYINGSLATAKVTSELAENLLSVASQHDHQQLLAPRYHLDFIDSVGDLWHIRSTFSKLYDKWIQKKACLDKLQQQEMEKEQRKDFLSFQVQEISEAKIIAGEDEKLSSKKNRLKGSDRLIQLGQKSYSLLNQATASLPQIRKNLDQMTDVDSTLSPLADEIADYSFQLEEKLIDLRSYLETIPNDPYELDTITARLDI